MKKPPTNAPAQHQAQHVLTDAALTKIAASFDKARVKSMKKKQKDTPIDFVEVK